MDENQKLEYLNRNSIKKYSGWKNYSPNVWTALHWNPKINQNGMRKSDPTGVNVDLGDNDGALCRSNRPQTAPPVQFGLNFNAKNEIPQKVNYLMETIQDLQFQIQHFQKNLSQQNELIENLTDVVERLTTQNNQNRINNPENDESGNEDKQSDEECKENNDDKIKKSKKSSPKKIAKVIFSKQKKNKNRKKNNVHQIIGNKGKGKIIPTYFAVDAKELKNNKVKPEASKDKKDKKDRNKAKANKNKPITPRVVKSNKIKRKKLN